jgi:hypothetical protein
VFAALIFLSLLVPVWWAYTNAKVERRIVQAVEAAVILGSLFLAFDAASLVVLVVRNL